MSDHNGQPPMPDLSAILGRAPVIPYEVQIIPYNATPQLMMLIAKGFVPQNVFLGPVNFEQQVEVEVDDPDVPGAKRKETQVQRAQKMDYVVWLLKTNSPLEVPKGTVPGRA